MDELNFSVSMCVYGKDNSNWFDRALESVMVIQTRKPNEISLVIDGPIPKPLEKIIKKYTEVALASNIRMNIQRLEINQGHGNARRMSVSNCHNELIAIMDADDVANPHRFEEEINKFAIDDIDICGGNISEFIGDETHVVSHRNVPECHGDIVKYAKSRCPMNQMTVMFKRSIYETAGGYIDWYQDEDYYLWLRMLENGAKFANTGTTLVNVRVGEDMYMRRGGIRYYKSEKRLQKYMLEQKFISYPKFISNCTKRLIVQVLLPNRIRGWVFKNFARS